jgi:hypothetical protein
VRERHQVERNTYEGKDESSARLKSLMGVGDRLRPPGRDADDGWLMEYINYAKAVVYVLLYAFSCHDSAFIS